MEGDGEVPGRVNVRIEFEPKREQQDQTWYNTCLTDK